MIHRRSGLRIRITSATIAKISSRCEGRGRVGVDIASSIENGDDILDFGLLNWNHETAVRRDVMQDQV